MVPATNLVFRYQSQVFSSSVRSSCHIGEIISNHFPHAIRFELVNNYDFLLATNDHQTDTSDSQRAIEAMSYIMRYQAQKQCPDIMILSSLFKCLRGPALR